MEIDVPKIVAVPDENNEDSLVDLIFRAHRFDCFDILEFECYKKFGHDSLTRLTAAQESYIVLTCRAKVARQARKTGYRPKDWDAQQ
ncbi:hypothetical protein LP7551_02091 [Roseibium album]|nr:hypothetical protein LP7551_02091 [Roseibium album]